MRNTSIYIPYDKEITSDLFGQTARLNMVFKGVCISFSPKLILNTESGKVISSTLATLFDQKLKIEDGGLFCEIGSVEALPFFIKLFSFLNIIGIPF